MRLIAIIRISHDKFHCNRLTTVQDIQDYTSLSFLANIVNSGSVRLWFNYISEVGNVFALRCL